MNFLSILNVILREGCQYAILALGVYITYSIPDFPDLTVDGSMPLGAITSVVLILKGVNPWLSLVIAFAAGCVAGTLTGLLHIKLKITPLLSGILVYTVLLSINLVFVEFGTGGQSIASAFGKTTIFNGTVSKIFPERIGTVPVRTTLMLIVIVIVLKVIIDLYLKTKNGMLLRATGNNQQFVLMLGKNPGAQKILGLAIGNGMAALSGAVVGQSTQTANTTMGVGMVVFGLSSVIIGLVVFGKLRFMKATTMVILGTVIYKACLQIALVLGLPSEYNKLLMGVLFVLALILSGALSKKQRRPKNA